MTNMRGFFFASFCLIAPMDAATGQVLYDGSGSARSGQTEVPGGILQWRFVETPRFQMPRQYRRYTQGSYGRRRYGQGPRARLPFGTTSGSLRSHAQPAAPGPSYSYRFDERRGVWIAEHPVGL